MDAQTLFIYILSLHIHSPRVMLHYTNFLINAARHPNCVHIESCYYEALD
jgi:hypothetical protein